MYLWIFIQNILLEIAAGLLALFVSSMIMGIIMIPCIMLLHYYENYRWKIIRKQNNPPSVVNKHSLKIQRLSKILLKVHIDGVIILTVAFICCYVHPWVWGEF